VTPFDTYKCYLSLKNHFVKDSYDYFKYCGKSRSTIKSFYGRRDRFWFEKVSRQKTDQEVVEFFVANFIHVDDPSSLWIGSIIHDGDAHYKDWQKRIQSLSYLFKEESKRLFEDYKFDQVFDCSKSHPVLLKMFLGGKISLETMVIYDRIFLYGKNFDKKLKDPVWETVSMKIRKYSPFIHIDVLHYRKILKEVIVVDQ
tara:strand:- start:17822 stop:18418 length:597 start_codon:yes stop_codon:yes gene_type:complete